MMTTYECKKCGYIMPVYDRKNTKCPECGSCKWIKNTEKRMIKRLLEKSKNKE